MRQRRKCRQADEGLGNDARTRTRRAVEHPRRKLLPASPIGPVQRATEINAIRLRNRRMDMNVQAKPRMPPIENFADNGPVGVLKPCCTMAGDPTPALTGRRRTRPTSIGCRNPWQPKPRRAPLIAAQAAVQTNRATSQGPGPALQELIAKVQKAAGT